MSRYFLELVKSLNLCILNGRMSNVSGLCTTINSSVVDYLLSNVNMIEYVKKIYLCSTTVLYYLMSTCHYRQLNDHPFTRQTDGCNNENYTNPVYKTNKWTGSKLDDFIKNIDGEKLQKIQCVLNNTALSTKHQIEKVCNDIQHVLDTASKETFGLEGR